LPILAISIMLQDMRIGCFCGIVGLGLGLLGMGTPVAAQNRIQPLPVEGAGTSVSERIAVATTWLVSKQNDDGSWGSEWKGAMTGLVMQALLENEPKADAASAKGAVYLIALAQQKAGFLSEIERTHCVYEHAIALKALIRFGQKGGRAEKLLETASRGLNLVIENQQDGGGWSYGPSSRRYAKVGREDMSVTWWQFLALQAAAETQIKAPRLRIAIEKATKFVVGKKVEINGSGLHGFGQHSKRGEHYGCYTMTGPALAVLAAKGPGNSSVDLRAGFDFLEDQFKKEPPNWNKNADLYVWYGTTLALKNAEAEIWEEWAPKILMELAGNQRPDGSWPLETGNFAAATSNAAGPDAEIYRTALCTLMLQLLRPEPAKKDREQEKP
jgi:hypothetical protein